MLSFFTFILPPSYPFSPLLRSSLLSSSSSPSSSLQTNDVSALAALLTKHRSEYVTPQAPLGGASSSSSPDVAGQPRSSTFASLMAVGWTSMQCDTLDRTVTRGLRSVTEGLRALRVAVTAREAALGAMRGVNHVRDSTSWGASILGAIGISSTPSSSSSSTSASSSSSATTSTPSAGATASELQHQRTVLDALEDRVGHVAKMLQDLKYQRSLNIRVRKMLLRCA